MLATSEAVATGGSLEETLRDITLRTSNVVDGARGVAILLTTTPGRLRVGGVWGMRPGYSDTLGDYLDGLEPYDGPSGWALRDRLPVVVEDMQTDERVERWRSMARNEGYRGLLSMPLMTRQHIVGTLTVFRDAPGPWEPALLALIEFLAQHAGVAVYIARLLDERARQLDGLERLVQELREQAHEHANRLYAIAGLLELGEADEARGFVGGLLDSYSAISSTVASRIRQPTLAGFIRSQAVVAEQRGITLVLDDRSSVDELPPGLSDALAVTVVGNLLDNAYDAVAELQDERRRVRLSLIESDAELVIEVRDHGLGIRSEVGKSLFARAVTTKAGHQGLGLSLVQRAVDAAFGSVEARPLDEGTLFTVRFPKGARDG
jgi:signal transduction histidine kinase